VTTVGILGLGEAGSEIAAGLHAAGATVRGYDPLPSTNPDCGSEADVADGADIVLSLTTAEHAAAAARATLPALHEGQVYADLNTSAAALKVEIADLLAPAGVAFADVALMSPAPGLGLKIPALASGPGAKAFAEKLGALGMPVDVLSSEPGDAARRKLLRSIAWKGLSLVVVEAMAAARAAGEEQFMREQITSLIAEADIDRMDAGSRQHAVRREHEMEDVIAQLRELDVEPRMSTAARDWLAELARHG
jgi:3-hydroxyisobutyrate dehydrogenase-like beta-hydroxyacid dehydrogenase